MKPSKQILKRKKNKELKTSQTENKDLRDLVAGVKQELELLEVQNKKKITMSRT